MKNWGEGVIWHENDAITGIIIFFIFIFLCRGGVAHIEWICANQGENFAWAEQYQKMKRIG